ncbi:hypothetical protein ATANTOWER_019187 [Ataeniobius toweri]|uniref:Uncharacterized protein n=1 Tax=Ataeniobius toweri TaxID=208326 RepID=A0ABU7B8C7_9TELE|nr:hypothetical protein [Ataeniobius toweri]
MESGSLLEQEALLAALLWRCVCGEQVWLHFTLRQLVFERMQADLKKFEAQIFSKKQVDVLSKTKKETNNNQVMFLMLIHVKFLLCFIFMLPMGYLKTVIYRGWTMKLKHLSF